MNHFLGRTSAAALIAAILTAPASAFDISQMSPTERQSFRDEIRGYLLDNPEVLMEAIGVLEQRQAQAQAQSDGDLVADNAEQIFDDGRSWVGGNPDGDLTLVEFVDYRCGYCRRAFEEVEQLVSADGNIRFIIKEFPILGEDSLTSARFAIATRNLHGDAAYEAVHEALMTLHGEANEAALRRIGKQAGLDPQPILAAMEGDAVTEEIRANHALAEKLAINGTPTFILQDEMLRGYVPFARMQEIVQATRAE